MPIDPVTGKRLPYGPGQKLPGAAKGNLRPAREVTTMPVGPGTGKRKPTSAMSWAEKEAKSANRPVNKPVPPTGKPGRPVNKPVPVEGKPNIPPYMVEMFRRMRERQGR